MDPDVDDLASRLFHLDLRSLTTGAVTALLTREIVSWAVSRGWWARTEARVDAALGAAASQLGFMDVVVHRGVGQPDLAIEIDSTHKPWSVDKLRHAVAGGMHAIWIRWGDDSWAGLYDGIDVVQLYTYRLSRSGPMAGGQLDFRL